jgi:hypothetical protein
MLTFHDRLKRGAIAGAAAGLWVSIPLLLLDNPQALGRIAALLALPRPAILATGILGGALIGVLLVFLARLLRVDPEGYARDAVFWAGALAYRHRVIVLLLFALSLPPWAGILTLLLIFFFSPALLTRERLEGPVGRFDAAPIGRIIVPLIYFSVWSAIDGRIASAVATVPYAGPLLTFAWTCMAAIVRAVIVFAIVDRYPLRAMPGLVRYFLNWRVLGPLLALHVRFLSLMLLFPSLLLLGITMSEGRSLGAFAMILLQLLMTLVLLLVAAYFVMLGRLVVRLFPRDQAPVTADDAPPADTVRA